MNILSRFLFCTKPVVPGPLPRDTGLTLSDFVSNLEPMSMMLTALDRLHYSMPSHIVKLWKLFLSWFRQVSKVSCDSIILFFLFPGSMINQARWLDGWSALHVSAMMGLEKVVDLLLKVGADPALVSSDGMNASQIAMKHNFRKKFWKWSYCVGFGNDKIWQTHSLFWLPLVFTNKLKCITVHISEY